MQTTTVKISSRVVDRVKAQKPEYIGVGGEIARLVEIALDTGIMLGKPTATGARGAAVFPSLEEEVLEEIRNKDVENFVASVKKQSKGYTPGFNDFWKTYQSCPEGLKVKGQSKPKAFEEYKAALSKVSAEDLLKAAQMAVEGQLDGQRRDEFTALLPDAFRWLKNGKWEVLLESHVPAQSNLGGDWLV